MELGDRIVVMSKGRIAQIGTPREIYFESANRFVAEFIGAANILEAPVENGQLVLPGGRLQVEKTGNQARAVAMIRPETIGIIDAEAAPLTGTVETVRFAGDRLRITVRDAAVNMLALEAPNAITVEVGDRIGLSIAPDAIRLLPTEDQ